jgi:hypothetical protein
VFAVTNFERFQTLQVELVRAGFDTLLSARPSGDRAVIELSVNLERTGAETVEKLDVLVGEHGFSFTIGPDSRASLTLTS